MTPKSNDTELKKFDFSQKPMGVPPIPFWGLEMVNKGVSIAFLLSVVTKSGSITLNPTPVGLLSYQLL